jgi:hypothetical protein
VVYVYNISGDVANIFYQSCALIDNNQQVYEAQIQVPRCKKGIITHLLFLLFCFKLETNLDNKATFASSNG